MKLAQNKKAKFDYELLETIEAGLVLTGQEVKSVRDGGAKLLGSFVSFHNGEAYISNMHISKYKHAGNMGDYDPSGSRKLLLTQKEIAYLRGKSQEKGLTIVPISLYTRGRRIKMELAVARGKKKHDKRRAIKDREQKRKIQQYLRG